MKNKDYNKQKKKNNYSNNYYNNSSKINNYLKQKNKIIKRKIFSLKMMRINNYYRLILQLIYLNIRIFRVLLVLIQN